MAGLENDWQAKLKRVFILPLILGNIAFVVVGIVTGWWGVAITASGQLLLFALISMKFSRRVNAAPAVVIGGAGVAISFTQGTGAAVLALLCFALLLSYVFWYSTNGRTPSAALAVGSPLPELTFTDLDGNRVSSTEWMGSPTVLLFYRGTWCPLCTVQVREVASEYRDIEALGARVVLVSPQPATESAKLAQQFDAPMTFLVDEDNAAARVLGIQHPGGAPLGVATQPESVLPTAVVLDADGVVRFAHETDNYRIRPDPELFLDTLRTLS
ncbi:MAG: peroxiredoxin family protein [Acidimicrobiales bacterium]|nr:peroxiredoxin family protein [Acidimicrobiales bacterium]